MSFLTTRDLQLGAEVARQWQNHEYHERLDTHGMVLENRDDIERGDTMIYTIEKL